jgi:hypothetical protein
MVDDSWWFLLFKFLVLCDGNPDEKRKKEKIWGKKGKSCDAGKWAVLLQLFQ